MDALFTDRRDAGRQLAQRLGAYRGRPGVLVLALARGGMPVGVEVARSLGADLDVFAVRKLGVPGYRELALGAIAPGGVRVLNEDVVLRLGIPEQAIDHVAAEERVELERRERVYRGDRPAAAVKGRTVILVDDGLATGATMRATVAAVRRLGAEQVVVAVPVAPADTCRMLAAEADEVVCPATPEPFCAIGCWYDRFQQVSDAEVRDLLAEAEQAAPGGIGPSRDPRPRPGRHTRNTPASPAASEARPARQGHWEEESSGA